MVRVHRCTVAYVKVATRASRITSQMIAPGDFAVAQVVGGDADGVDQAVRHHQGQAFAVPYLMPGNSDFSQEIPFNTLAMSFIT